MDLPDPGKPTRSVKEEEEEEEDGAAANDDAPTSDEDGSGDGESDNGACR